jgi:biotin carboxylase
MNKNGDRDKPMKERQKRPNRGRLALLLTAQTYRAPAFLAAAERLDIEVVQVMDMARPLAEFWHFPLGLDYNKLEEATQALVAYAQQYPLAAIRAVDDSGSMLAAHASAALGLPHNSPAAAVAARDKYLMRQLLSQAGVQTPAYQLFSASDNPRQIAGQVEFPVVVKPLRLSGSRGVIRANDPDSFSAAFQRTAALLKNLGAGPHSVLVEQFVPGFEVAVEGIVRSGRLKVLALFDKPDPLDGPFFEETIYVTPSRLPEADQNAIARCAAAAAAALGLHEGPIHAEVRLNSAGAWLIEIAGRSIGGLCSQTLRFSGDATLEELILRQAFNLEIESLLREQKARGVMMIPIPAAGLLKEVRGIDEATAVPGIEEVTITAKLNYPLTPLPEGDSYLGFIFAFGETAEEVEASLRQAHNKLQLTIDPIIPLMLRD